MRDDDLKRHIDYNKIFISMTSWSMQNAVGLSAKFIGFRLIKDDGDDDDDDDDDCDKDKCDNGCDPTSSVPQNINESRIMFSLLTKINDSPAICCVVS